MSASTTLSKVIANGVAAATTPELMEMLFGADTIPHINAIGGIVPASKATVAELMAVGMSGSGVATVSAVFEVARRALAAEYRVWQFDGAASLAKYLIPTYGHLKYEVFGAVAMDARNNMLNTTILHTGGTRGVYVDVKMVFKQAITDLADRIVIFHNHPSGSVAPSKSDDDLTRRIVLTGKAVGIDVVEHLILGGRSFYSYAEQGRIHEFGMGHA